MSLFLKVVLTVAVATTAVMPAAAQNPMPVQRPIVASMDVIAGRWTGSMTIGDREYPINLWFEGEESRAGRFQIVGVTTDQNPLREVRVENSVITFNLPSNPVHRFRGTVAGRRMSGTVDIGGSANTFSVQRMR